MNQPTEDGIARLETLRLRECGGCRACCKVGYVDEWGYLESREKYYFFRPYNTWCWNAYEGGCRVWGRGPPDRPVLCDHFRCGWLNGLGQDYHRPDKIRAVTSFQPGPDGEMIWVIYDMDAWSCERGRAQRFFRWLRKTRREDVLVVGVGDSNRRWVYGALQPVIYTRPSLRPQSLAWKDHDHEMVNIQKGVRRCGCGFVDMRKEKE